jgi:ribosomal protein S6--L-glutamate ligase
LHVAVLGNANSWYVAALSRAARARGHRCARVDFRKLTAHSGLPSSPIATAGNDLCAFNAVIVRTMPPGSLEQVVYRMDALLRLERAGVVVLNPPKAIECAVDKYLATWRLEAAGLPVPPTIVCENAETAMEAFDALGGDAVVKPLFGSEGRGIVRVSDPDLALRTFRTLERIGAVLYLQKCIEHEGYDVRVLVLEGRTIGAIRRRSADDFRTNVSRNGRPEPHELTATEVDLALRAAEATGSRFAGVDLLYDLAGDVYVIEVNAVPGWRAFQRVTGIDVAGLVIETLELPVLPNRISPDAIPAPSSPRLRVSVVNPFFRSDLPPRHGDAENSR